MKIQLIRRKSPLRFLPWMGGALLISLFLSFLLPAGAQPGADPLLGRREEWALYRGAPEGALAPHMLTRAQLLAGPLMLADPAHPLPADFPAPSVRDIQAMVSTYLPAEENVLLRQDVIYALCAMQFERDLKGSLTFTRGAVSPAQPEEARKAAFDRYAQVYPRAEALRRSQAAVPAGGQSEHQTGWAVDLALTPPLKTAEKNPLRRNAGGQWVWEHMWRFGLIQRFGPGDGGAGSCEEIHLRYVGLPHAAAMQVMGLGLEDYLSLLRREGALTLCRREEPYAYIYCSPLMGDWAFSPPCPGDLLCSADNAGFAIAAVAAQGIF